MSEQTKWCKFCCTTRPIEQFSVRPRMADGRESRCKPCRRAYDQTPERQMALKEYRSKPHVIAATRARRKSAQGRKLRAESDARYPCRNEARNKLAAAIKAGKVKPFPCCEVPDCSSADQPEGHHVDYSAPLLVTWLCKTHHGAVHALTRNAQKSERVA